jgi:hypothetical protein
VYECRTSRREIHESLARVVSSKRLRRFPIRFDGWYRMMSSALLLLPSRSYVELDDDQVVVRMGWAFRARFPRAAVASVTETVSRPLSRGVHGFAGQWLVNGSGDGILTIDLTPRQRAYVMGFPIRLRRLMVSVADPTALRLALRHGPAGSPG